MYKNVTLNIYIYKYIGPSAFVPLAAEGLSSSWLRGTQGARPHPARKFGPWPRSAARAVGVQNRMAPRGGIPCTYSHPRPCKPMFRLKRTSYVSCISNVTNVVRHYHTNMPDMRPRLVKDMVSSHEYRVDG